jgi:hypothetical protein
LLARAWFVASKSSLIFLHRMDLVKASSSGASSPWTSLSSKICCSSSVSSEASSSSGATPLSSVGG